MNALLPLAARSGSRWIALAGGSLHPDVFGGAHPDNLSDAALEKAAKTLAPLARRAAEFGVRLTLEPHIRSVLATPERAARLCALIGEDAVRITLDPTNFMGFLDLLDPLPLLDRCATALSSCCGMVHIKEITPQPGFHLHAGLAPVGTGRTDWERVLQIADRIAPPESWVLVEHCANAAEARESVRLMRSAAARRGLNLD